MTIQLRLSNGKAYVWDADDVATLRSEHHICGILVGTLPHLAQQNVFLGLPLILLPEEVVLLVDKGIAVLVNDSEAHRPPSESEKAKAHDEHRTYISEQIAVMTAKEKEKAGQASAKGAMSDAAIAKRLLRERRRVEAKAAAQADAEANFMTVATDSFSAFSIEAPISSSGRSADPIDSTAYPVVIASTSDGLDWYQPELATYTTISSAKAAGIWTYPSTLHDHAKCGIFRALWERGYFMGGGLRFGGDYLVYPGDPLRYHSHFVATVLDSPESCLRPMEVVAHGRLGTGTKKAHLLCGWDDVAQKASFLSVEWAGFG